MTEDKEKNKKKKARAAFLKYKKKLTGACGTFSKFSEWYDSVKELVDLIREYQDILPSNAKEILKIDKITNMVDPTRDKIEQVCEILDSDLQSFIDKYMPKPSVTISLKLVGTSTGGIAVAVVVAVLLFPAGEENISEIVEVPEIASEPITTIDEDPITIPDSEIDIDTPIPLKLKVSDISSTNIFSQLPLTLSVKVEVNPSVENAEVEFFIDAKSFGFSKSDDNGIASKTISNLDYTEHQWYAIASKEGYISSEKFETTSFTLEDINPPQLEITSHKSGQYLKESPISLYGTLSDEESGITQLAISINDQIQDIRALPNWQFPLDLIEGTNFIVVFAEDKSGQKSKQEITLVLDTVPPEVQASTNNLPNSEGWFNFPVTIKWIGVDENNASCTKSNLHKENGIFVLTGECFDQAGNQGTGEYSLKYDSIRPSAPEISVFNFDNEEEFGPDIFSDGLIFEFDSQDNLSGVNEYRCSYNNSPFTICSNYILKMSPGEHQFKVKSIDLAENESDESIFKWLWFFTA